MSPADPKPHTYSKRKGARSGKVVPCDREGCENTLYRPPSHIGARNFCSRACMYEGRVRPPESQEVRERKRQKFLHRTGENNPNFKNGNWTGKQDRELNRCFNLALKGEHRCRVCGSSEYLVLHHVIPRSLGTKESRLNILNGLPLCGSHHMGWHRHSKTLVIHQDVFTLEEWNYLVSVPMSGRVTQAWLEDRYPLREAA